jgi:DNA ligase (NAD+)
MHSLRLSATQAQIKAAAARVSASVSKKNPYVVACEEAGSKLSKTKALRVPILTETDLLTLLDQSQPLTQQTKSPNHGHGSKHPIK